MGGTWDHFEHTCAYARWAHMHCFLSVRPSGAKIQDQEIMFVCKLQVYKALAGGLISTSSCIFHYYNGLLSNGQKTPLKKIKWSRNGGRNSETDSVSVSCLTLSI